jgi:hypothetical protein
MRKLSLSVAVVCLAAIPATSIAQDPPQRVDPESRLAAPGDVNPSVKLALDAIKSERLLLPASQRTALDARVRSVTSALRAGDPCRALGALRSLRSGVDASGVGIGGEDQRSRGNVVAGTLQAEALLLFGKGTKGCGGGVTPPRPTLARQVVQQSKTGLTVRIGLPTPRFDAQTIGEKSFVGVRMGPLATQGPAGQPALPSTSQLVAIPDGATVKLVPDETTAVTLPNVDVAPAEQDAPDQEPTFNSQSPELQRKVVPLSSTAYAKRTPIPARAATLTPVAEIGGVRLAVLKVAGAQYVPGQKRLKVFTSARLSITFAGGKGTFADQRLKADPELSSVLGSQVLNFKTVAEALGTIQIQPCGEDLMIITTNALRGAADRLASTRTQQGIATNVYEVGQPGVGTTKESIRTFIQSHVMSSTCEKRPKWVVLLGDAPALPTWTLTREIVFNDGPAVPSDLPYSQSNLGIYFPNVAIGRIPAGNLDQAIVAVNKQIFYAFAPSKPNFLSKAVVAGFFQVKESDGSIPNGIYREARRYMTSVVRVRAGLQAFGKTVDTFVTKNAEAKPLYLNDGTLMPSNLWNANNPYNSTGTQIRDAINDGRWLVFHRDHAGPGGWGDPGFGAADVDTLTNGVQPNGTHALPLVLSINCSSGGFDAAGQNGFADRFMFNPNGGAVGVVAATRTTPSFINEEFARPLADALTGGKVLGGSFTPINRVSSMLVYAKIKLLLAVSDGGDGSKYFRDMMRLYQYFGDPSVRIKVQ